MDYAAAAAAAARAPPAVSAADPHHPHYPHPYASYAYPYHAAPYHPGPTPDPSTAASSSYYYPTAASTAAPQYVPYAAYQYSAAPTAAAVAGGGGAGGLSDYYFGAGEAFQGHPASQGAPAGTAAAGKEAGKHFGFNPQRYAQAAAARSLNGITPPVAAPGMHHAQWNAHFGHPVPKTVSRKHIKKKPKVVQVQPLTCEVCKIQCDTPEVLRIHKTGKKHKKNLERLQDSITPKPVKPPNTPNVVVATSMAPAAVTTTPSVLPAVQAKKKKSSAATPEELEVKKRRVLEAGAAQGEVKICTVCNVVVNSQKVYEFHIVGQKHQAMVQKQQAQLHIA